ncbi:cell division protein FtsQ/DivIB, partial [Flavobacteriaceae bacterium]|nr:cell division protein FtsQ/DivIB [Flavobacteriaceae bacterium]
DREPIAVLVESDSYIDSSGVIISSNNILSDSLPQIIGTIAKVEIPKILKIIKGFNEDKFFHNKLESISFKEGEIYVNIKNYDLDIRIGNEYQLKNKLKTLKGFYAYQNNKSISKDYKQIDLVYNNRLIAIKK